MSSVEKLIERCATRLYQHHCQSRYGHDLKRSWGDLALVEKLKYRRAAEVVLDEAGFENAACKDEAPHKSKAVGSKRRGRCKDAGRSS